MPPPLLQGLMIISLFLWAWISVFMASVSPDEMFDLTLLKLVPVNSLFTLLQKFLRGLLTFVGTVLFGLGKDLVSNFHWALHL